MIESIISLLAVCFGLGDGADKVSYYQAPEQDKEMIRVLDGDALKGFDNLEIHQADEWFV